MNNFKINDDDKKFWIAFYDRDAMNIPIEIFAMDVILLQNCKPLYS